MNHFLADGACLYAGDNRDALRALPDNCFDSCVTDPPYALVSITKRFGSPTAAPAKGNDAYVRASAGFMGKQWDTGECAMDASFWAEVLRVLKPGGFIVAFGGTRTYHRLACAVEDAGFEIRDMLSWLYGTGFPKSHDVSKGIDKAAGAEREIISERKTGWQGTLGGKAALGGLGNAEDIRTVTASATEAAQQWEGWGTALKPACEPIVFARKPLSEATVAANVLRWGTGAINIDGCRVAERERHMVDEPIVSGGHKSGRFPANVIHDGSTEVLERFPKGSSSGHWANKSVGFDERKYNGRGKDSTDSGSAARFFYSAKANKADRAGSKHPTVKPIDLMAYLCRLITPPGGVVLDPFAGSGTTGVAALAEGFRVVLCEREAEYVADIRSRFAK